DGAGQFLAYHRAHAAGHEGEVGHAEGNRPAADVATTDDGRIGHPRLALLGPQAVGIGETVLETQRVAGVDVGEPLLEAVLVEQLGDAVAGRQVEVVIALRVWTDVEAFLDLLAKDRRLAVGATNPQPLRDAAFHRSLPRGRGWGRILSSGVV